MNDSRVDELSAVLVEGGIAVVRTDTLYGVIALASNETAVEKVYEAKHRNPAKQCIVLVADAASVPAYERVIGDYSVSDRPTTIVVPSTREQPWLLRGGDTIAYRVVTGGILHEVIKKVGPIIAPSANPEGLEPSRTVEQARDYFGTLIDLYIDDGEVPANIEASRIIEVLADGTIKTIRR